MILTMERWEFSMLLVSDTILFRRNGSFEFGCTQHNLSCLVCFDFLNPLQNFETNVSFHFHRQFNNLTLCHIPQSACSSLPEWIRACWEGITGITFLEGHANLL